MFTKNKNNFALEHVDNIKDLGVIVVKDLSFDPHIFEKDKQSLPDAWNYK